MSQTLENIDDMTICEPSKIYVDQYYKVNYSQLFLVLSITIKRVPHLRLHFPIVPKYRHT